MDKKKCTNNIQRINIMFNFSMLSPFNVKYAIYYYYLLYSQAKLLLVFIKKEELPSKIKDQVTGEQQKCEIQQSRTKGVISFSFAFFFIALHAFSILMDLKFLRKRKILHGIYNEMLIFFLLNFIIV